ncbi:unnamed protein product, partial [Coregonus sp. 'balchen']
DWLTTNQTLLQQKNSSGDMPADIDTEIAWANGLLKESESRKADLAVLMETSAGLQGLVEGSKGPLEDRLCGLNEGWGQVRTWTEDRLSTVLSHQNEVEIFDENLAHISTWLYLTQIHLDEMEILPTVEREMLVKTLLEELDDISLRVDSVRDQAIIMLTSRGPACRDVVEPKLAELNRNFHKVSKRIKAAKMSTTLEPGTVEMIQQIQQISQIPHQISQLQQDQITELQQSQSEEALSSSLMLTFEGKLEATLRALEDHQDPTHTLDDDKMDREKAGVEELLRRGEEVLLQTVDEGQREELSLRLLRLQTQYTTQRLHRDTQTGPDWRNGVRGECALSHYLLDINKVLLAMADNELLLNTSELSSSLYEDFSSQEDTLRVSLEHVGEQVTLIHERQPDAILEASQSEVAQIGDTLIQLNAEWDRLNRMYNHRNGSFDRAVEEWRQFHCDLNDLISVVPSAVQMASLMSEDPHYQTPNSPELVVPTDLNNMAMELAEWLLLITQMLKSNIVTVGDTDEIRTSMGRLHNIKNKTSNLDIRTSITEKLEKVHSQWDNTQQGVEARLQQLDNMIGHSDQWEEQRQELKALICQNEGRLHNLLQLSREPLTKQLIDNKVFLQDLGRGQGTVTTFNELSNQLLREANDHQAQLDSGLKWLQEAETIVNILVDASQREELSQDSAHVKKLRGQLE